MKQDTALLVMDMQVVVLGGLEDPAPLIENISRAINHARSLEVPVIYVTIGFRAGAPEVSDRNKIFGKMKERASGTNMEALMKIHPGIFPQEGDIVVVKRRVSAFSGSDLEVLLRSLGVCHLVLTGMAVSGVVLSTLREAADKDFQITVIADCCGESDPEVHHVLTNKVFVQQANVLLLDDWIQ